MPRRPKNPTDLVAVRLDRKDIRRIDALKEHLSMPWHQATQSDVLRALILWSLDEMERDPEPILQGAGVRVAEQK